MNIKAKNPVPLFYRFSEITEHPTQGDEYALPYIVEEIENIISSRCNFGISDFKTIYSVINYGIPDLASTSTMSDLSPVSMQIRRSLDALEPRIEHTSVEVTVESTSTINIIIKTSLKEPADEYHEIYIRVFKDGRVESEIEK